MAHKPHPALIRSLWPTSVLKVCKFVEAFKTWEISHKDLDLWLLKTWKTYGRLRQKNNNNGLNFSALSLSTRCAISLSVLPIKAEYIFLLCLWIGFVTCLNQ